VNMCPGLAEIRSVTSEVIHEEKEKERTKTLR